MERRMRLAGFICGWILVLTGGVFAQSLQDLPEGQIVGKVGKSALVKAGEQYILLLQGTHYEIGFAYGKLLAEPIAKSVEGVLQIAQATDQKHNVQGSTLETIYQATNKYIPQKYKDELQGLADGSGVELHKLELVNVFPEMFHCSTFTMVDKATKDGQLIHGRILDYAVGTKSELQKTAVVIVIRPDGENAIMLGSYIGLLGCITGINDKEIAIGMMGMGNYGKWEGYPMSYLLRNVLEDAGSLDEALPMFQQAKRTCEYAYVISDGKTKTSAAVHATPEAATIIQPGQAAAPNWPEAIDDCVVISASERYPALVKRIRENFGKIDLQATLKMMTRPVSMECNLHNAVLLPKDKIMYLANAAVDPKGKWQACYQPYYKYDLSAYLTMMDQLKKDTESKEK